MKAPDIVRFDRCQIGFVSGIDFIQEPLSSARLHAHFQVRSAALPVQLHVAANQYLMSHQLPEPIREFTERHPAVRSAIVAPGDM